MSARDGGGICRTPNADEEKDMSMSMKLLAVVVLAGIAGTAAAAEARQEKGMSEQDKLSYALGMAQGDAMREYQVDIDPSLYEQGFRDALAGRATRLTKVETQAIVATLQTDLRKQAMQRIATQNLKAGEAFLAANKDKEGVVTLDSGVQYKILKASEGEKPGPSDTVSVHYRGSLVDGRVFASFDRGNPKSFTLGKVIPGLREALQLMPVGSRWQIVIPPGLAYGERTLGRQIGPNSTLVFEVELLAIEHAQDGMAEHAASDDEPPAEGG